MIVESPDYVKSRYKLHKLKEIEDLVANTVQVRSVLSHTILWLSNFCTHMPTPYIMIPGLCIRLFECCPSRGLMQQSLLFINGKELAKLAYLAGQCPF